MYYVIASGKKKSNIGERAIENVCKELENRGAAFKLLVASYAGHSVELAKQASAEPDCEAIIAVGGDGTFFEILNGMDTKVPVGLIPAGTGNDFARAVGISTNIQEAVDNIVGQKPRYLDYLKIGNYRAFNVVGSGFDIQLLEKEKELREKHNLKDRGSYSLALTHTLLHLKFEKIHFRVDEGEWLDRDIFMLDCCNGNWGAGKMPLCLTADPHDGQMEFVIIKKFFRPVVLFQLLKFKAGKLAKTKYVETFPCKKIEIDMEPRLKVNMDGELRDLFPITVELIHNELRYFASRKPIRNPFEVLKDKNSD